ncbi:Concanavalin A-like lectin/glucanase, subgroup [Ascosphaera apis ARSEF 7405]|uniref:chitinase n=1 Tax=Ascosphaera apis ARSEF 7405 TaxID=392613 RepID=A0A162HZV4_9EURO|nr:Concanavalin A-like lectin/glucanase, subgroup [Ascosphaera apis ARSEF 7405]
MRAAKGAGIISCVVLMSDDLDEIDWEFIGSKHDSVETDYFGKGNDTLGDRELTVGVPDAMDSFHNYTWDWTHERIEWWIDGNLVRTLNYEDALGGKNYPQTPARLSVGMWSGGDSKQPGTVQWAGGKTDYSQGPFVMTVKSLFVKDYSHGKEYEYGDHSGDWQSIKINEGKPFYKDQIEKGPPKSLAEHWKELSKGAKAGIFIGIAVFCAAALAAIAVCCVVQRKRGKKEYTLAQTEYSSQVEASEKLRSEWQKRHASSMYTRLDKVGSP